MIGKTPAENQFARKLSKSSSEIFDYSKNRNDRAGRRQVLNFLPAPGLLVRKFFQVQLPELEFRGVQGYILSFCNTPPPLPLTKNKKKSKKKKRRGGGTEKKHKTTTQPKTTT